MAAQYEHSLIAKTRLMDRINQLRPGVVYNERGWGNDQDDYDIQRIGVFVPLIQNASVSYLYEEVDGVDIPDIPEGAHDEDLRWSGGVYMNISGGYTYFRIEVYLHWRQIKVRNTHLI